MRRFVRAAGLVLAGVLGEACGGDDDADNAGSTAPAASAAPDVETSAPAAAATAAPASSAPAAPASSAGGGATTQASGGGAEEPTLMIIDFTFPADISVAAGSTVTIQNNDSAAHTVTADDGSFDVEIAGGGSAEFTAPAAGSYAFACNFHATMQATLTVT